MVEAGELGQLRVVQVEYAQDWLTTPVEATGNKQAVWRTDPAQSGPAGSVGDIGTHAYNIGCVATGMWCQPVGGAGWSVGPGPRPVATLSRAPRRATGAAGV